ncbi:MAG: ABC transporter permease [Firmicutes bacterium]|nr:ABC transporter permease [Candidatus Colimorpha enterica]
MSDLSYRIKSSIRTAYKSIKFNFRQFIPFFCIIFFLQVGVGVILSVKNRSDAYEKNIIRDEYRVHLVLYNLNDAQLVTVRKYGYDNNNASIYRIAEEQQVLDRFDDRRTDVRISLIGDDAKEQYKLFKARYFGLILSYGDGEPLSYYETPALKEKTSGSALFSGLSLFLFLLLSFGLLTAIYTIRINNYRFEYGIYMACGADYRKLIENSVSENWVLSFFSFLPALAVWTAVSSVICGKFFFPTFGIILADILLSSTLSALSVLLPMLVVSKIYPLQHITAADNSNYVVSPRRSRDLLKAGFGVYQRLSVFRFRKYYVRIIACACAFTVAACAVYYGSYIGQEDMSRPYPSFTLSFGGSLDYDPEVSEQLRGFEGVKMTFKKQSEVGGYFNSHLAVKDADATLGSDFVGCPGLGKNAVCHDRMEYTAFDREVLDYVSQFDVDGEPEKALEGGYVVICPSRYNSKQLEIKPGDKVYIAVSFTEKEGAEVSKGELNMLSDERLLRAELEIYDYRYKEMTVAAVINDMPTGENMPVYMCDADFKEITGKEVAYRSVDVYCDGSMTKDDIETLEKKIKNWAGVFGDVSVTPTHLAADLEIEKGIRIPDVLKATGIVLACCAPVIWFFSETVFYEKRRNEAQLLSFLGAENREIKKIYVSDALVNALISFAVTAAFSSLSVAVMHAAANRIAGEAMYYRFSYPVVLITAMSLSSALISAAAVMIAYFRFIKGESGQTDRLFDETKV